MLFALYPTISQHYFVLCFVSCLGVLQWVAARHHQATLSLLGRWGLGWAGLVLGAILIVGSFGWFFTYTPHLFAPGLAGGELSTLFVVGGLCALLVARLAGWTWQQVEQRRFIFRKVYKRSPIGWLKRF
jgi:hypothetical protein